MIVFFAVLGNVNEWGEIESFEKSKEGWLRRYLELPFGVPTDDTYRVLSGNISTEHFFQVTVGILLCTVDGIIGLAEGLRRLHEKGVVCADGKVGCGSGRKDTGNGKAKGLQTLNVYSDDYGMCLAQRYISEKTNEIPAAQEALHPVDLKGTMVAADAMNCQKGAAEAAMDGKGDYVLALKGDQTLSMKKWKGLKSFGMVY